MTVVPPVRITVLVVCLIVGLLGDVADAGAQINVGTGPLTGTLAETEPTAGVLSFGPLKAAPGLIIRELGWDSNVFAEPASESPKEDYVAALQPDLSIFMRLRFVKISAYGGSELTYYRKYESERSVGHSVRGRVDLLFSRMRPFVAGGQTKTRARANSEIDVRANRKDEEFSGGFAFDLSAHSLMYVAAVRTRNSFEDAFQQDVNLGESMTRQGHDYSGGLRTDITPLLALTMFGGYHEDLFSAVPERNTESYYGTAQLRFAPEGVINGTAAFTYRDMTPVDPGIRPFRGILGQVGLTYRLLEVGRLNLGLTRNLEYSFDTAEAYYLENSATLAYTHRVVGAIDVQAKAARSYFDYSARDTVPAHKDTLDTATGSLGYNLRNRTRVALNYEYSRRRSPEFAVRDYDRRRAFLSWLFAF